jgi:hypothetical protein
MLTINLISLLKQRIYFLKIIGLSNPSSTFNKSFRFSGLIELCIHLCFRSMKSSFVVLCCCRGGRSSHFGLLSVHRGGSFGAL